MRKSHLLLGALLVGPATGFAADDEVIVYGARMQQPVTEVGSSVTIITADEIEAQGFDFVVDALATAPSVTINQNGTFGGSASVRIRGASSEQTLVIIDGVVANDPTSPGGGYDFARLDPSNIERIEILRGPQSTLWGTDAIGGVINIITKRPVEGSSSKVFAQGGSFGSLRAGVDFSGAGERFDYRFAATTNSTDGISKADEANGNTEEDSYDSTTLSARLGSKVGAGRLQLSALWTDAESEFDSFVFGAEGNVGDGDELSKNEELTTNLTFQVPLLDGRLDNIFLLGYSDSDRNNFTDGAPSFSSKGDRLTYRYQGTLQINDGNRLAFGLEREDIESNGNETSIDGIFALYEAQPTDTVTLSAGLRRDDHEEFGGETTARLAAAYNPNDQITLSASWGEGFKAPTLFQTTFFCCGAAAPNPDLQPETSDAYDIGVVYRSSDDRGEIGLTYFNQDTTNLITFSFGLGGYENIARAKSKGIELHARYRFTDWLGATLNFANIDAEDGTGAQLIRVPENSGDLGLALNPDGRLSGVLSLRYNGEEQDPNGVVDAWYRVDLAGEFALSESIELYARIENLFDEQYQQILGYGTPGLSGYLGARLAF
ncbi:MAG: TonB-dependent receptor plug domain-containing protein [Woeseiaceae bacterium]